MGSKAGIYQTAYDGKLAFLTTADKPVDKICANEGQSQVEERLSKLKTEISELKSLLLLNAGASLPKPKTSGLGEIRTLTSAMSRLRRRVIEHTTSLYVYWQR